MNDEEEALAANAAFYAAFAASDAERMDAVWARRAPVACVHPGWEVLAGRDSVMESWRRMFETGGAPPILCEKAVAHLLGPAAFVTCLERVPGAVLVATNALLDLTAAQLAESAQEARHFPKNVDPVPSGPA